MRRGALFVVAAVWAVFWACAGLAHAQTVGQDSVVGDVITDPSRPIVFVFDAHSGPSGQNPTGTAVWRDRVDSFGGPVTCMSVTGNRATIGFKNERDFAQGIPGGFLLVEDNGVPGAGQDNVRAQVVFDSPPTVCPPNNFVYLPYDTVTSGDITVVDAQPPSTYTQCRQAGWVKYGFASHAACIDYVHQKARQKCIFERVAHGVAAFRAKYGLGPTRHHAMRHCVRLHTGF